MKKVLLMLGLVLLLTGCTNSIVLDFKDNINVKLNLAFTLDEYKNYMFKNSNEMYDNDEAISSIDALRTDESDAFINGNGETFKEDSFINNGNYYSATYEYNYNYQNIVNSSVLNKCFEYFNVTEDSKNIYLYATGKSICAPFKLVVKCNNRMVNNNASSSLNDEYTWNISEYNNNVNMVISKNVVSNSSFSIFNIICLLFALLLGVGLYFLSNRVKKNNY